MAPIEPLPPEALYRRCDPALFDFATTEELAAEPDDEVVGQERALAALRFGLGMRRDGRYHIFALGPEGVDRHGLVRSLLERRSAAEPTPDDWCYVHNFAEPHRPRALRLPAGRGAVLRGDFRQLVEELRSALPAAFEGEDFRTRKEVIEGEAKRQPEQAFGDLQRDAQARGIALLRTPMGMALAPVREGEVLPPDAFNRLPPEERERIRASIAELEQRLEAILRRVPEWERDARAKVRQLVREVTTRAVEHLIDEVRGRYRDLPAVLAHLDDVQRDVLDNVDDFLHAAAAAGGMAAGPALPGPGGGPDAAPFRRYRVNLLVDRSAGTARGAPVVHEDHPTVMNLLGRVEHIAQFGALLTDFNLIKPGALHRANGGYLLLEVRRLLLQPFAWEELKRVLRAREIRIESLAETLSLVSTVSLEPEPIPLDVKVVLIGDRLLYYLLCVLDPDVGELFKVPADFGDDVARTDAAVRSYARLIAGTARREGLRPLERDAVARVIEHAARHAEDARKLSVHDRMLADLLREADYVAAEAGNGAVTAADVQRSLDARVHRADRARERIYEQIDRGTLLIDTIGAEVGQINGLVVAQLGGFTFGWPGRITARVRLGRGRVVDIEREVELGGPIHAKGVLILAGFLGARYAGERPLSLHASLVFEQSYGPVEGDSASAAELYALLSALAEAPIRQALAVTGSVNQHGRVQPVGGVNEKIEGFFDVCSRRGLTGEHGVLIPRANVQHLMLRHDVVQAAAAGRFHIYAVETIDEGIELLTGVPAGAPGPDGAFPEGSINRRVEDRLAGFSEALRRFVGPDREEGRTP